MPINLTNVRKRLNNIKNKLYYPESRLIFYNINVKLLELDGNFFRKTKPTQELATRSIYYILYVAESEEYDLSSVIPVSDSVDFHGKRYKIIGYDEPDTYTKQWKVKLETTGQR